MHLIILKRKELTDRSWKMWESTGTAGQLTLDQHIGWLNKEAGFRVLRCKQDVRFKVVFKDTKDTKFSGNVVPHIE